MALSYLDFLFVYLSDVGWISEWVLLSLAFRQRWKRRGCDLRTFFSGLGLLISTVVVLVLMKAAAFDLEDPTSLRPSSRKTSCGAFDFGEAPSAEPSAGYPSGHAYLSTLATVLLASLAYFEDTPWGWVGFAATMNLLTLVARRGLMCHTMVQIVDGFFLGALVGACATAAVYAGASLHRSDVERF